MKFKNLFSGVAILATSSLMFAGSANATVVTCSDLNTYSTSGGSYTGSGDKNATSSITFDSGTVSAASCGPFEGNDSNDLTAAFGGYGFSDWIELDKADGADSTNITGTGWGGTSGTFTFSDAAYDSYLITLKFDGVYSTYLSDTVATNWGWNTDVDGDGGFAISHLSVYVRNSGNGGGTPPGGGQVPAPATLALMGLGLLGLGASRRNKKA